MTIRFFTVLMATVSALSAGVVFAADARQSDQAAAAKGAEASTSGPRVRVKTSLGDFVVELDQENAPISTFNFLAYVDQGFYKGTIFHRVESGFVVQGGGYTKDMQRKPTGPPIRNEWQNGLKNTRGTIAMARSADPNSATSQFYINLANNLSLDVPRERQGNAAYAVFGRVVEGMDVVDKIQSVKVGRAPGPGGYLLENVPVEPVVILGAERLSEDAASEDENPGS